MSNKYIFEKLLSDIQHFANSQQDRSDFALNFMDAIESLDDVPFSVIDEARDWQYKIETQGSVYRGATERQIIELSREIQYWVRNIQRSYS